jgi:hypothetical protein
MMRDGAMPSAAAGLRVSHSIRQLHRWLSVVFTACVIANFAAMAIGPPPPWIVYSPLPSLFLMLVTGLYMFARPYWRPRRGRE